LDAFVALDELGVLPQCTCTPTKRGLDEERLDEWRAHAIRVVAKRHHRAAMLIARYPETYVAVQEAIDARIIAEVDEPRDA
jgi:hypothetical protein